MNTSTVAEHRALSFHTPDELFAEVDRLAAAERAGTLRRAGNWTLGQNLGHLASWIDFAYDGYPPNLKAPWFVKIILKTQKKKYLRGPLPRGVKIPKLNGGTLAFDVISTDDGRGRLERAWARLRKAPPGAPNPVFGPLTHDEWLAMHMRHAELHLGYLHAK